MSSARLFPTSISSHTKMNCLVCFETPNKSTRAPSSCPSCASIFCRQCIQTYLLQEENTDPTCPNPECKKLWTQTFLYSALTSSFRLGPFKAHREKVLFDREKARLPDTQDDARRYKDAVEIATPLKQEIKNIQGVIAALPDVRKYKEENKKLLIIDKEKRKLDRSLYLAWYTTDGTNLRTALDTLYRNKAAAAKPYYKKMYALHEILREPTYICDHWGQPYPTTEGAQQKEKRTFLMKCPSECEGFLSTQYKCGLCDLQACNACHEPKNEAHVCDPSTLETIKQIRKEARPCPKCAALISKIDGCDQMWCTQCQTAFSWNTGHIETRVVHNPHYFQWMREQGGQAPRRDVPGMACAGIITFLITARWIRLQHRTSNDALVSDINNLEEAMRRFTHIREVEMRGLQAEMNEYNMDEWRRILRVQRLVGTLSEETWKDKLQRKEKAMYKITAWYQLLDMYTTTSLETIGRIERTSTATDTQQVQDELTKVKEYVITEAAKIAHVFGCVKPECLR